MKITSKRILIVGLSVAIVSAIVLVSGVFPVKASSGHWPITAYLLDYASDRSVAFHSRGIEVPDWDDSALIDSGMVTLGAATYESNCKFCHGQPGEEQPPVAKGMTPTPPLLRESIPEMDAAELFYILKHGIKFAGMPAWPTQTCDDEIWPLVAFLQQFPVMDNASYQTLVSADPTNALVAACAACHGEDGNGRAGQQVPILAGQNEAYLRNSLLAYRAGDRNSGIMMPIAHRLSDDEISKLAEHYAGQERQPNYDQNSVDKTSIEEGRRLAHEGDRQTKIPSCVDCHGPGDWLRSDDYPRLAGQSTWYIEKQLQRLADRHRGGTVNASLMHPIAAKLDAGSRRDIAAYYCTINDGSWPARGQTREVTD